MSETPGGAVERGKVAIPAGARPEGLDLYRQMLAIRRFEEKVGQLYGLGEIGGFCRLGIGQEAVAAGLRRHMQPGDSLVASHPAHGHLLAAGLSPELLFRDLMGRSGGLSEGRSGLAPLLDGERRLMSGLGTAATSLAVGSALAARNTRRASVTWCALSDDVARDSDLADAIRAAAAERLAMIFVIESDDLEPESIVDVSPRLSDAAREAVPPSIPAQRIDGVDVEAVRRAAEDAAARARAEKGPQIVEMPTFRYRGHALAGTERLRSPEALQARRELCDPIERLKASLLSSPDVSAADLQAMDREIRNAMSEAVVTARRSPAPLPEFLTTDETA